MNKKTPLFLMFMSVLPALVQASETAEHAEHYDFNNNVLFPYANFLILLVLLFIIAKKPISEFFLARSKEIAASLDQAAHEKQEALTRYQQQANRLQNVEKDIEELKLNFKQQGDLNKQKLIADSRENAKSVKDISARLAGQELLRVKTALREEAVNIVLDGAGATVKNNFNEQDQAKLFQNNLGRLEVLK